jgi:hypothetical protein
LSIRPCGTSSVLLHAVKSYDMGPSRFTSHPRGRCAADFYRIGRVLNPLPLGPVASTLTTTPPRRLNCYLYGENPVTLLLLTISKRSQTRVKTGSELTRLLSPDRKVTQFVIALNSGHEGGGDLARCPDRQIW